MRSPIHWQDRLPIHIFQTLKIMTSASVTSRPQLITHPIELIFFQNTTGARDIQSSSCGKL